MKQREVMSLDETIAVVQHMAHYTIPSYNIELLSAAHHLKMYREMLEAITRNTDTNGDYGWHGGVYRSAADE